MNDELLESLLDADEGTTLDFKREQYPFGGASEEEQSKLLKHLLAFANAWRTEPAYILIGVDEVRGGRSRVVGEEDHPPEESLQQFVHTKTNRPLEFSYEVYSFRAERVGIFRIPVQYRPVVARRDFGKVEADTVYVRRGSSTDVAGSDEVARMGGGPLGWRDRAPKLELEWADLDKRERFGTRASLEQVRLDPRPDPELLKPRRRRTGPFDVGFSAARLDENPSYYEDLVEYVYRDTWFTPLGLTVKHAGGAAAKAVELVAQVERSDGLKFLDPSDAPRKPSRSMTATIAGTASPIGRSWENDLEVEEYPGHWTIRVSFGDVSPQRRKWSSRSLYVGATESTTVEFTAMLYAENLPEPAELDMGLSLEVKTRRMEPDDVKPHLE